MSVNNATGGYVNTTRILLDYGANPNERKPNGWTALLVRHTSLDPCDAEYILVVCDKQYGCKSGSEEVVRELVNLGASTDVRNKEKATPLYIAARCVCCCKKFSMIAKEGHVNFFYREGSNEVVTFLVDHCNADPAAERTTNGRAPLHTAISNTDPYVFDTLIQKTRCLALPSIKDNSAHTLHHEAADVGSISCCSVLEKFSFRFWTAGTNIAGQFPLQLAVLRMHEDFVAHVLQLLKEQNHSQSGVQVQLDQAVYDACTKGCSSILTMLLENGANPNYCGKRRSALHAASLGGTRDHIQCVETLLQHGADPTFQDIDGLAALESTQSLIHEYVSQTGTVRATTANSQEHRFACLHKTVEVLERHMTRKERRDKPINQYNRD